MIGFKKAEGSVCNIQLTSVEDYLKYQPLSNIL